ncbi:hypothetical protein L1049_006620 [Liquidambar formosana]|uniref:Uncharacterized protein n=1 Tax=Liquidambar formosana TaxID=63359 RepID=A0AAP0RIZ8_LIQFO
MEIINPSSYYDSLKRYWRRRRYQRLNGANTNKRKLKIMRLGGNCRRRLWTIRAIPRLRLRLISPIKLLAKFHDAYINMMIRLACNVQNSNRTGAFRGKRIARGCQISMASSGEEVDSRLVLEIYKRMVSTREVAAF